MFVYFFRCIFFVLLSGMVVLGVGCQRTLETPSTLFEGPTLDVRSLDVRREVLDSGIERVEAYMSTSTSAQLVLFGFDQERFRFRFVSTSTRLSMARWSAQHSTSTAGINGVYFHEDLTPSGWFLGQGMRQTKRAFNLDQSALIQVNDRVSLVDTAASTADLNEVKQGAQTYPILIENGGVKLTRDTGKTARRSWIGVDNRGWVWIGVLPNGEVSLFALAQRLMELGIAWEMVVNLDGGPSTGMFIRKDGEARVYETIGGVPNVLLIERRAE